ncbi:unnamed protein product, partial [marine sediment metagenome]
KDKIKKCKPSGIILELIQGNGGTHQLDFEFVKGVRKLCDIYNITMIVDEIQTGFGRCGELFLCDLYGLIPDVIVFGKAIGNGFPLFGTISKPRYKFEVDDHSFTFTHFPVSMAAGLAYLRQVNKKLLNSVMKKAGYIVDRLTNLRNDYFCLGEIRGMGLFLGVDIIDKSGNPDIKLAEIIEKKMLKEKIIIGLSKCKGFGYNIKFKPMLNITYSQINYALDKFEKVLTELKCTRR